MLAPVLETLPSQAIFSEGSFDSHLIALPSPSESLYYEKQLDSIRSWSSTEDPMFSNDPHGNWTDSESLSNLQLQKNSHDDAMQDKSNFMVNTSMTNAPTNATPPLAACTQRDLSVMNNHVGGSDVFSVSLSSDAPPTVASVYQHTVKKNKEINVDSLQLEANGLGLDNILNTERSCSGNIENTKLNHSYEEFNLKFQSDNTNGQGLNSKGLEKSNNERHFERISERNSAIAEKYSSRENIGDGNLLAI